MFVASFPSLLGRIRRAAAWMRAFALLEDPPRGPLPDAPRVSAATRTGVAPARNRHAEVDHHALVAHLRDVHPHRRALPAAARLRRPGVSPPPAVCLTPLLRPKPPAHNPPGPRPSTVRREAR